MPILARLQGCFPGPWLFVANFNAILGAHEKRGRRPPLSISCNDFLAWTNANLLNHLPTNGVLYTWSNGRLGLANAALRLDISICYDAWVDFWHTTTCSTLIKHRSG